MQLREVIILDSLHFAVQMGTNYGECLMFRPKLLNEYKFGI